MIRPGEASCQAQNIVPEINDFSEIYEENQTLIFSLNSARAEIFLLILAARNGIIDVVRTDVSWTVALIMKKPKIA